MKNIRMMIYTTLVVFGMPASMAYADAVGFCDCSAVDTGDKVVICHVPKGNPDNAHTISVAESAVKAHVKQHGDTMGACPAYVDNDNEASDDKDNVSNDNAANMSNEDGDDKDNVSNMSNENEADAGAPCVCSDGSVGEWMHGEVKGPQSTREVHGK